MYTFYGLVLASIVFGVFVTQCHAARDNVKNASKTSGAGRSRTPIPASRVPMSAIFEDRVLVIETIDDPSVGNHESYSHANGRYSFHFGSYAELKELFKKYGKHARRISIDYSNMNGGIMAVINNEIIRRYANYFTELTIFARYDKGIWDGISDKNGDIRFPNVEKFVCEIDDAHSRREPLDLSVIFPKLEVFELVNDINDKNCLKNVKNLKELIIHSTSIPEPNFRDIFVKNNGISNLCIPTGEIKTLQAISENLKNLETLEIEKAGDDFLKRGNRVYLTSVKYFVVGIIEKKLVTRDLSFKMPNLERLLVRACVEQELSKFINNFENLDTVEIKSCRTPYEYSVECIEKLTHVKEFISSFNCSQLTSLIHFFETFDKKKSNLNLIKLECIDPLPGNFKQIVKNINVNLKKSNKPTWTLSDVVEGQTNYLLIKRNL